MFSIVKAARDQSVPCMHGLSSLASGGGKMRDPGNEVGKHVLRVSIRHLPIVLVKVAYYASGSVRFLPKLCSNYARFSKLCYFLKKLYFTLVTLLVPLLLYFPVVDSRRLSRASCAGFGLSSLFSLPCKLSGCKFTALDWFGVAAAILKRALGERLRSLGPRHRLPVPFHRTPAVSQQN